MVGNGMGLLTEILKDVPLSAVLREKVLTLERENESLKDENASLKDDLRELRQRAVKKPRWDSPYYWVEKADGGEEGPFCQHCYDKDGELRRLQGGTPAYCRGYWKCTVCKNEY